VSYSGRVRGEVSVAGGNRAPHGPIHVDVLRRSGSPARGRWGAGRRVLVLRPLAGGRYAGGAAVDAAHWLAAAACGLGGDRVRALEGARARRWCRRERAGRVYRRLRGSVEPPRGTGAAGQRGSHGLLG